MEAPISKVEKSIEINNVSQPQCHFYVVRKKRLCRMTVRPGREYCGEHEPQPRTEKGKDDTRIPCPYDPKHTCYASKLLKHLAICNARQAQLPDYIVHNINNPADDGGCPRIPLREIPQQKILALIHKVNILYDKHVRGTISSLEEDAIHPAVLEDFHEAGRADSSRRHLRQASSLLRVAERAGLPRPDTCYVELGAGKGHLSYYAARAWCGGGAGRVLLVDRASLRHKRDNKLRRPRHASPASGRASAARADDEADSDAPVHDDMEDGGGAGAVVSRRVRADLAHLHLARAPGADGQLVGLAKHLCGAATDFALRCLTAGEVRARVRGLALATCCHHRCARAPYVAARQLQEMGFTAEELNIMLGIVSWATCGDGRSRQARAARGSEGGEGSCGPREGGGHGGESHGAERGLERLRSDGSTANDRQSGYSKAKSRDDNANLDVETERLLNDNGNHEDVERDSGMRTEDDNHNAGLDSEMMRNETGSHERDSEIKRMRGAREGDSEAKRMRSADGEEDVVCEHYEVNRDSLGDNEIGNEGSRLGTRSEADRGCIDDAEIGSIGDGPRGAGGLRLAAAARAAAGRRAKRLLDEGRARFLRGRGFDARLVYYVPPSVSPENVCIVATRL